MRSIGDRTLQIEGFDWVGKDAHPATLIHCGYCLYNFNLVFVAFNFGLDILTAAIHGAHASLCHHFHSAWGSFM